MGTIDLGGLSQQIETGLADNAGILSLFGPGRDLVNSPTGQSMQRRAEGRRLSSALREVEPDLEKVQTGADPTQVLKGPKGRDLGVSIPGIGNQAILERVAAFEAAGEIGAQQQEITGQFSEAFGRVTTRIEGLQQELARLGPQTAQQYGQAINRVDGLRRSIQGFVEQGFQSAATLLDEIRADQQRIRSEFTNEITARAESMGTGIRSSSNAAFNEHVRALEAGGGVSNEERASLRALYDRDASRTVATSVGGLHEAAALSRTNMNTQLNSTLTSAISAATAQTTGLLGAGIQGFSAAQALEVDLVKARSNALSQINNTRTQLSQIGAATTIQGAQTLFDMVTNTVHPVMVISDIMSGVFSQTWSAIEFNNNIEIQELMQEAFIQSPLSQGFIDAMGMIQRNREFEAKMDAQDDANSSAITGSIIGAAATIAAPFTGGLSLTAIPAASAGGFTAKPGGFSDRNMKEDIHDLDEDATLARMTGLPVFWWKYIGDPTQHVGPMAQDFQAQFALGDGKTINYLDAIGVLMASVKSLATRLMSVEEKLHGSS